MTNVTTAQLTEQFGEDAAVMLYTRLSEVLNQRDAACLELEKHGKIVTTDARVGYMNTDMTQFTDEEKYVLHAQSDSVLALMYRPRETSQSDNN